MTWQRFYFAMAILTFSFFSRAAYSEFQPGDRVIFDQFIQTKSKAEALAVLQKYFSANDAGSLINARAVGAFAARVLLRHGFIVHPGIRAEITELHAEALLIAMDLSATEINDIFEGRQHDLEGHIIGLDGKAFDQSGRRLLDVRRIRSVYPHSWDQVIVGAIAMSLVLSLSAASSIGPRAVPFWQIPRYLNQTFASPSLLAVFGGAVFIAALRATVFGIFKGIAVKRIDRVRRAVPRLAYADERKLLCMDLLIHVGAWSGLRMKQ